MRGCGDVRFPKYTVTYTFAVSELAWVHSGYSSVRLHWQFLRDERIPQIDAKHDAHR